MSSFLAYGQRFRRATLRDPCPVCGQRKSAGRCGRSEDGALAVCMFSESDRPLRGGLGWLHVLTPGVSLHPRVLTDEPPVRIGPELAEPERLDAVLGALFFTLLSLTDRHRRKLLRRGLDAEAVRANGYATLPGQRRSDVRTFGRGSRPRRPWRVLPRRGRGEGIDPRGRTGPPGSRGTRRSVSVGRRCAVTRQTRGQIPVGFVLGPRGQDGSGTPLHWTLAGIGGPCGSRGPLK